MNTAIMGWKKIMRDRRKVAKITKTGWGDKLTSL